MKALAVINKNIFDKEVIDILPDITIAGQKVSLGVIDVEQPQFDVENHSNDEYVLVRVLAFSCNYRDKGIIVKSAINMEQLGIDGDAIEFFGSDFVATVVDMGKNVTNLSVGDRVIPNCYYPSYSDEEVLPGVVTNEASRGWLKIHYSKLLKIEDNMGDAIAASFSIGAQTSSSMIRKTHLKLDNKVLVTSGRSNTSQFIVNKLLRLGFKPDVLTTSDWSSDELDFISPAKVIKINKNSSWDNYSQIGLYDAIFDPFFDLYMADAIKHLKMDGKYITCGYKNQHQNFEESSDENNSLTDVMLKAMIQNVTIIGNCIGLTSDLIDEIKDYDSQYPPIMIDRVYNIFEGNLFLDKTYNDRRFGKAVLKYS